jgi:hypothetical protein
MCQYLSREKESPEEKKITMHVSISTWRKKATENQAFADMISLTETEM